MWFTFVTARLFIFLSFQPRLAAALLRSCSVVNSPTRRVGLAPTFKPASLAQALFPPVRLRLNRCGLTTKERISMNANNSNRWLIAAAGVVMQLALGAVYAWSVFRIPLAKSYGWTVSQVTLAFELAILMLGFASF